MSYNIEQYTTTELFDKAVAQAAIMQRAPHNPANKTVVYNELLAAIVTYHATGNDTATTKAILETAGATGASAKVAGDALS